jgi:endoglycosylceramidase
VRVLLAVCGVLALWTATAAGSPTPPLRHAGRWITDAQGRATVLHGVNFMDKRPPYLPAAIGLDDDDAAFLHAEGFNAVRLGVMAAGVEPAPGVYSQSYLDGIAAAVRTFARHGVLSLVDFHQDFYNQRFGGQGMPDWMVLDDGLGDLPVALTPNTILRALQPSGTRVWDNFWANKPARDGIGLQDHYAADWAQVAKRLRHEPSVIGFDLMNEPWPGSAAVSCINVVPGCPSFDRSTLSGFYRRVIKAIRGADSRTPVHYEPELLTGAGVGYDMGDIGDANAVLSFHVYCVTYTILNASTPGCEIAERQTFANAESQAARSDDASLLTEFGSTSDTSIIQRVAGEADRGRVGWLEWTYYSQPGDSDFANTPSLVRDPRRKPEGSNVNATYLGSLSRAYPQSVAGTPRGWSYDPATRRFALSYSTARADGRGRFARKALTEIVVPHRQYPKGYAVQVDGGVVVSRAGAQILKIRRRAGATGVGVTVYP